MLLVVGNSNGTVPAGSLSIGDAYVKAELESEGHSVSVRMDSESQAELASAAQAAELVVVVESVTSMVLGAKLRDLPVSILNYEAFIQDEMGMTAAGPGGDPGAPDAYVNGVLENRSEIEVMDATHPLAAGLQGTITVYREPKALTWGKVAPSAQVIAALPDYPQGSVLYVYEPGADLWDGTPAPGMRIGFFLEDDNETGTPNFLTEDGLRLFRAAVGYALGETVGVRSFRRPPVSRAARGWPAVVPAFNGSRVEGLPGVRANGARRVDFRSSDGVGALL